MRKGKWILCILVVVGCVLGQPHPGWTTEIAEMEPNDLFGEAQSLDGFFSTEPNPDIYYSTTVPHASVSATIAPEVNDVDYYSFTVVGAGLIGFFDIDYGWTRDYPPDDVNTVLSLFDADFNLLAFNDNIDGIYAADPGSTDDPLTVDHYDGFIGEYIFPASGTYYIAVSSWGNYPNPRGTQLEDPLLRPDGAEAGGEFLGDSGDSAVNTGMGNFAGNYTLHVSLSEAAPPLPEAINAPVDIKPGSCRNPINTKSEGVFSVAILGTEDLSVYDVDESSLTLEGVPPIRSNYEDVATPFEPGMEKLSDFDCPDVGPDGFLDFVLKFRTQEVLEAVEASLDRDLNDGEVVWLTLRGNLMEQFDSAAIEGEDAIVILRKGKK